MEKEEAKKEELDNMSSWSDEDESSEKIASDQDLKDGPDSEDFGIEKKEKPAWTDSEGEVDPNAKPVKKLSKKELKKQKRD